MYGPLVVTWVLIILLSSGCKFLKFRVKKLYKIPLNSVNVNTILMLRRLMKVVIWRRVVSLYDVWWSPKCGRTMTIDVRCGVARLLSILVKKLVIFIRRLIVLFIWNLMFGIVKVRPGYRACRAPCRRRRCRLVRRRCR